MASLAVEVSEEQAVMAGEQDSPRECSRAVEVEALEVGKSEEPAKRDQPESMGQVDHQQQQLEAQQQQLEQQQLEQQQQQQQQLEQQQHQHQQQQQQQQPNTPRALLGAARVQLPAPDQHPRISPKVYRPLKVMSIVCIFFCLSLIVTSAVSFSSSGSVFFPCTTTVWSVIRLFSMIPVVIASFRSRFSFLLTATTAISVPFLIGDLIVLVFCTLWYPRPIPSIGYWVLGCGVLLVIVQTIWVIISSVIIYRAMQNAGNVPQQHLHTTKHTNEDGPSMNRVAVP